MKTLALAAAMAALAAAATAQDVPVSRFGPEDQAGGSNLMTPEKALEAVALIKTGTVLSI